MRVGAGRLGALAAAVWLGTTAPGLAQKSKDTLRVGVPQPITSVDTIFEPQPLTNMVGSLVFDTLVAFDPVTRSYVPHLADSWSRIDATTWEVKLKAGIRFHDGSALDADDVVEMIRFVTDPGVRFRLKGFKFGQIAGAEKVDDLTVRIKTKAPFAAFLSRLATVLPVYPSDHHGKLSDKSKFGQAPVGSGPYKALEVDPAKGVVLVANPDYRHGSAVKPAARIGRIVIEQAGDLETQLGRMLSGQQDVMFDVAKDVADNLRQHRDIEISVRPSVAFAYLVLDAAGRSKTGALKDKRVREAVFRAIDRQAIALALQPKGIADAPVQPAMCHGWHVGCASSAEPPAHDVEAARKLLGEAKAGGFALSIATTGAAKAVADAVAEQLRRIGIDARVETHAAASLARLRAGGQLAAHIGLWDNGGAAPDVEATATFFLMAGPRNYSGDKEVGRLTLQARGELDPVKRAALYKRLFDRVTTEHYAMALMPLSSVIAHSKDVGIGAGGLGMASGLMLNELVWK